VGKHYDPDLDYKQKIEELRGDWEALQARKASEKAEGFDDDDDDFSQEVHGYFHRTRGNTPSRTPMMQGKEKDSPESFPIDSERWWSRVMSEETENHKYFGVRVFIGRGGVGRSNGTTIRWKRSVLWRFLYSEASRIPTLVQLHSFTRIPDVHFSCLFRGRCMCVA